MDVHAPDFVQVQHKEHLLYGVAEVDWLDLRLQLPDRAPVIGIDPGQVNMGLTVLRGRGAWSYQIKLPSTLDPVERVTECIHVVTYLLERENITGCRRACVEYAAFAALYGQVALAENRTSAVVALLKANTLQIDIPSPGTIRKEVFGTAKEKAEELWPFIPKDAASSLGCALYAFKKAEG